MSTPYKTKKPGPSRWPDKPAKRPGPDNVNRGAVWQSDHWVGTVRGVVNGRVDVLWVERSYWDRRAEWERNKRTTPKPRAQTEAECMHSTWPPTDPHGNPTTQLTAGVAQKPDEEDEHDDE